jgi:hypothetical protein
VAIGWRSLTAGLPEALVPERDAVLSRRPVR